MTVSWADAVDARLSALENALLVPFDPRPADELRAENIWLRRQLDESRALYSKASRERQEARTALAASEASLAALAAALTDIVNAVKNATVEPPATTEPPARQATVRNDITTFAVAPVADRSRA